ncbi:MAG: LysR family transcriptional regulator [Pseudomonadota bacterium]
MDWDDLRFIIAVYDNGSALAAAHRLGVNASTVQRRVARFEERNNVHLFDRLQGGLSPTAECEALVEASRDIDERVARISREILGRDLRLEGTIAVTSTETFLNDVIASHIKSFHDKHPSIHVELTLTNSRLNLSRQDADIAIRPSENPQQTLVGQRVADLGFGIYASDAFIAEHISKPLDRLTIDDLKQHKWLGIGDALSGSPAHRWMRTNIPAEQCWISVDTFPAMATCVKQSMGLAVLPCISADLPGLTRLRPRGFDMKISVWVLTHPEIRNAARIRAFMDHITAAIRSDRDMLAG